jgi:hypothetical protein
MIFATTKLEINLYLSIGAEIKLRLYIEKIKRLVDFFHFVLQEIAVVDSQKFFRKKYSKVKAEGKKLAIILLI